MQKVDKNEKGFSPIEFLLVFLVTMLIVGIGFYCLTIYRNKSSIFASDNKAQQQSLFIIQYAKEQHFVQIGTNGDSGKSLDNTMAWYEMYYKTPLSTDKIKNSLETTLKAHGYKVSDNYFNPKSCLGPGGDFEAQSSNCPTDTNTNGLSSNSMQPYWVVYGSSTVNHIHAEIVDVKYYDPQDSHNVDTSGEHTVPKGMNVLDISLSD